MSALTNCNGSGESTLDDRPMCTCGDPECDGYYGPTPQSTRALDQPLND
jgi:hypothetical protein